MKTRILLFALIVSCPIIQAYAQEDSKLEIIQEGIDNMLDISQDDVENEATITQIGDYNSITLRQSSAGTAEITQIGDNNTAVAEVIFSNVTQSQTGTYNEAYLSVEGFRNFGFQEQIGHYNYATIDQFGKELLGDRQIQHGDYNFAQAFTRGSDFSGGRQEQYGNHNQAYLITGQGASQIQEGNHNYAEAKGTGSGFLLMSLTRQHQIGDDNYAIADAGRDGFTRQTQEGNANTASLLQGQGTSDNGYQTQIGDFNSVTATQGGIGLNRMEQSQTGNHNLANLDQKTFLGESLQTQEGDNNTAITNQTQNTLDFNLRLFSEVIQTGNNNTAIVNQVQ